MSNLCPPQTTRTCSSRARARSSQTHACVVVAVVGVVVEVLEVVVGVCTRRGIGRIGP
jgi:hypothetical protein